VRAWSDALNHGLNGDAAALFASGAIAVSGTGEEIVLRTRADATAFNASLACQGEIIAISTDANRVTATFRLDQRGTFSCPAPLTVDTTVFTVEDGKIVRWEQLPD
jgi:limonene-1,2-epoxide hydrolase